MTVTELIAELQAVDDGNRQVILSRDAEGNSYSPLYRKLTIGAYCPVSPYGGEIGLEELTDEDREMGYGEEDIIRDGQPAIILYPTN